MLKILLTGGTGRFASEIVKTIDAEFILLCRDLDKASKVYKNVKKSIQIYQVDLLIEQEISERIKQILQYNEKIDVLINNAAVDINEEMTKTSNEDFEKLMKTNLFSPYWISKLIIPYMIKNKAGRIINVSSGLSMKAAPYAVEYSMSKAGLDALSRGIAIQYANQGIRCNSVNISGMEDYLVLVDGKPRSTEKSIEGAKMEFEKIPIGRYGKYSEYVSVIKFLCEKEADYINGTNIIIDGGINSRR